MVRPRTIAGLAAGAAGLGSLYYFSQNRKDTGSGAKQQLSQGEPGGPAPKDRGLVFGAVSIQGRRNHMEDRWVAMTAPEAELPPGYALFGVFDGHGGHRASDYCADSLAGVVSRRLKSAKTTAAAPSIDIKTLLSETFDELDTDFLNIARQQRWPDGSTIVVGLLRNNELTVANAGDSRAILARRGIAHPLSFDHKPSRPDEEKRLMSLGAWQVRDRIFGRLNLSRGIGDQNYKNPHNKALHWVISQPDFSVVEVEKGDMLIFGTDGLWDVLSNDEVAQIVHQSGPDAQKAAQVLVDTAVKNQSGDNITALVIAVKDDLRDADKVRAKL